MTQATATTNATMARNRRFPAHSYRPATIAGVQQRHSDILLDEGEGVDLPDADLGIIVAASRSKRQMIQRMGRILRPKSDGRAARFVVLFITGTGEDPATGAHAAFLYLMLPHAVGVSAAAPGLG